MKKKSESLMYFNLIEQEVQQLEENIELWFTGIKTSKFIRLIEVNPEDGISNVASQRKPVMSCISLKSNAYNRAKAAAKRAILEAGTAVLKRFHQIKKEELKLHRRKSELKIDIEMAKVKADTDTEEQETPACSFKTMGKVSQL